MSSTKKYWKSVEQLSNDNSVVEHLTNNEFVEPIPTDEFLSDQEGLSNANTSRRDFLKLVGFSTAAATLAACEGPVIKSIPYVVQPDTINPGVADYYASTYFDGYDFANILVKTREGRPIFINNNKTAGAVHANARVTASVLSLYDKLRLKNPKVAGNSVSWTDANKAIKKSFAEATAAGKKVVLLTNTLASPSTYKLIDELNAKYATVEHVEYDAISESNALDAFEQVYGTRALANYDFSKANYILSIGADFLGDWQGGGYESSYTKTRIPNQGKMSKHIQLEANMSQSGAMADQRVPMNEAEQKKALAKIYSIVTGNAVAVSGLANDAAITKFAQNLKAAGSKGVLVCGIDDKDAQLLTLAINQALSSEAFDTANAILAKKGSSTKLNTLLTDLNAGSVHTLVISGVNPLYSLANAKAFEAAMKKAKLTVTLSQKEDETVLASMIALPTPHVLESWGDIQYSRKLFGLMQPTIRPLFNTQQLQDCLLTWADNSQKYYDYLKATFTASGKSWNQSLHDGIVIAESTPLSGSADASAAATKLASAKAPKFELHLYSKVGMGDGQQANNPWLQEFPDPITRVSWDNYATISSADAKDLGVENWHVANGGLDGHYLTLKTVSGELKAPVYIQPGQAKGTIGLAFGYGRKAALKEEMQVGVNAYTLYNKGTKVQTVEVSKADGSHEFACVQLHRTLMGRGDIVRETTLDIFNKEEAKVWNPPVQVALDHKMTDVKKVDLWESFDRTIGHHFNLSIDLNSCTGCGACVIACHAENNVPVVGKTEVRRSRDMHWLRIDRYYSSEETFAKDSEKKENFEGLFGDNGSLSGFGQMEDPSDNPQVVFQPIMCQHCNHAPCETVCPVAATSHSRQGQNHMAYNRCVGTRYCANNCPYKVRRFNWFLYNGNDEFDYHMNDDLGRMVLNPDVNVRSRGVMEKCSMCIQMTQKTILDAKKEGRMVNANEFETACSNACSTGSLAFGDINEKANDITKLAESDRKYYLLEHVGTKPNVFYHVKVRNT
jgi:molybdopterin-containing oxidoreductase family iron-sulfur binding subunit